ncbi:hypothetical protein ETU37_22070 [Nocardioides iriomotensis]|uniref:Uncharacterized protein n=1 Tax=Nocardioides iriomotensis TaxID=715784 RepID=A0A4Q5IXZ8_9ACTN|nr:hypothetical protein ETU37_22070 [Nocardioides iriomotensis]
MLVPAVTVGAQDPAALGAQAAHMLFHRLAGDISAPKTITLPTRLVVLHLGALSSQLWPRSHIFGLVAGERVHKDPSMVGLRGTAPLVGHTSAPRPSPSDRRVRALDALARGDQAFSQAMPSLSRSLLVLRL